MQTEEEEEGKRTHRPDAKERARDSHSFSTLPNDNTRFRLSSQHVLFLPHSQEESLSTDPSQPQMFRQIQYPLKATDESTNVHRWKASGRIEDRCKFVFHLSG